MNDVLAWKGQLVSNQNLVAYIGNVRDTNFPARTQYAGSTHLPWSFIRLHKRAALDANAGAWLESRDDEAEHARERASAALAAFEQALADLTGASSAGIWVRSARSDQRWDRAVPTSGAGSAAPSSARTSANGDPLDRSTLLGYCRELVDPPAPRPVLHAQSDAA